ncbi:hypothetical protein ACIQCJ_17100 [Streptomyces sp. NPDC093221]|uniref:hypothetical protein n=1 Tax=unclassified Streptomyces TaxID=2593676 RepID=UPI0036E79121
MTDAHAYTQMMVGTNGAFFQMLGWATTGFAANSIAATPTATSPRTVAHAVGLFGQPLPPGTDLSNWWTIGSQYAAERS